MSDTENEELFTTRMRKATRKIHSISDALVNAKFAISLRDEKVWGGGLFVFYHIFAYLEEAKQRLNMGDFNKLFVHEILERKQAFEEDLKHYLGDDWQSMPKSKELENYLQHLQDLESENPSLLMAYVYHLYLGLLSGGQILAKKRRMFGDSTPETALPETLDETATSSKSACSEASTSAAQGNISAKEKEEFISKDPALKLLEDAVKMASLLEKSDSEKALTLLKTAAELSTAKSISTTAIKLEDTGPKIQSSVSKEWDSMSILQLPIFKKKRHRAIKHLAKKVQVQESVKLKQANEETSAELNTGTNNSAFKEFLKTISSTTVQVENKVPLIPGSVPLEDQISMSRSQIRKIRKFLKRAQSTKTSENASHEETNTAHESVQIEKGSDATGSVSTDNSKELSEGSLSTAVKMKTIEPTIPIWLTTEEVSLTKPQKRKIRKRKKARKQPTASSSKNGSAEETEEMNTKELDFNRKLSPASLISAEDRNKLSRAEKHTCSIKERQRIFSNQLIKAGEYAPVGHENNTPFLPIAVRADFIQSVESKEVFYDPSDQSQLAESADKNSEKIFTETSAVLPRYYEPENIPDEEQQIAQLTVGKNENESLGFDAPIISSTVPIISKPKNTGWLPALGDEDQEISYTARKRRRHSSTESLPDSTETQTLNISVKSEFAPREQFLFQSNFPRQTKPSTAKRVVMETVVNEKFSEANERTNFSPNDSSRAYVNRQDCQRLWTDKDRQYPQLGANTNPKEITSTSANEVQQNLQSGANKARDDRQSRAYDYGKRMQNLHNTWSTKNANVCSSGKRKRHIRNPWLEKEKQSGIITDDDLDDACCVAIIKPKNQIFSKAKLASIRSQVGQALNNRNACTGRIPSFRHVITSPRFIKVWCEDYFTVDWLRSVVSSIKDHPQLIVCRQSELLKRIHQISFSVPYEPGQGVTDLMHWIKTENDKWLDVESWTLQRVQRLTTLEDFDWKFYFEISETESENLARLNNYIYYKKRTIKVNTIDTYFEK